MVYLMFDQSFEVQMGRCSTFWNVPTLGCGARSSLADEKSIWSENGIAVCLCHVTFSASVRGQAIFATVREVAARDPQ